ncbi:MAG: hypothetical protein H6Q90_2243 [Deltaproteobacteria bacterium]|nr:hypothetical protein [Deltaproteobacteria bacterium]
MMRPMQRSRIVVSSVLATVSALAGCPSREPVNPAMTPAGPAPCQEMASHMLHLMKPAGAALETIEAIKRTLTDRCVTDRWTQDAQRCFLTLDSIEGSDRCAPLLTVDQRNALDQGMQAALGGR